MSGCKLVIAWVARKVALASGHYLVPVSKPAEWAKKATECEKIASRNELRGSSYIAGFWSGRGSELVRIGVEIILYNAEAHRIPDEASGCGQTKERT